jgi:hypothetical protein
MACIAVVLPSPGEMRWLERSDSTWRAIGRAVVQAFVYERYGPPERLRAVPTAAAPPSRACATTQPSSPP